MLEDYKKDIYSAWAVCGPPTSPHPDEKFLIKKIAYFRKLIICPFLPQNRAAKILDLGCGYGVFLQACAHAGYVNLTGIDAITAFTEQAQNALKQANIITGEIGGYLSQTQDTFDIITAIDVIEHQPKQVILDFCRQVHRILVPGGLFIIQVPNASSLSGLSIYFSDLTHEFAFTKILLQEILLAAGFNDIAIVPAEAAPGILMRLAKKIIARILNGDSLFISSKNIIAVAHKKTI